MGERRTDRSTGRVAALAAATREVALGVGLLPLAGPDDLRQTLATLGLIAPERARVGFDLPTTLAGPSIPPWMARLDDGLAAVRSATATSYAAVADRAGAVLVGSRVDHLLLRSADPALAGDIVRTVADEATRVEVWLDLAVDSEAREDLRAGTAQRLAVPGQLGHQTLRDVTRRLGLSSLRGDIETAYARGRMNEAAACVPDDLLAATTLTVDGLAERARAYAEAGVHRLTVKLTGPASERANALAALATAVADTSLP